MGKVYGYASIGFEEQENCCLEKQIVNLLDNGCDEVIEEVKKDAKVNKIRFNKLLKEIKNGDTLMINRLDNIASDLQEGSLIVKKLIDSGIKINILNIGAIDNTMQCNVIKNMFFALAEFEKNIVKGKKENKNISNKIQKHLKNGKFEAYDKDKIEDALKMLSINGGSYTYLQVSERTGISKSTLIRANNKRKH